jgi:hypothetical protein
MQRLARFSLLDNTIIFDSSVHPLCPAAQKNCNVGVCRGSVWEQSKQCWFHWIASAGVETRMVSENKEFGLFAIRTLKQGTIFVYHGKPTDTETPYTVQVTKKRMLDASALHSCPARYQ